MKYHTEQKTDKTPQPAVLSLWFAYHKELVDIATRIDSRFGNDAVSEFFLKICKRGIHKVFDNERSRRNYLIVSIKNEIKNLRVKWKKDQEFVREPSFSPQEKDNDEIRQKAISLRRTIKELSPKQSQAITLRLRGYTDEDVSRIMGITPSAAASNVHRARKKLQERLRGGVDGIEHEVLEEFRCIENKKTKRLLKESFKDTGFGVFGFILLFVLLAVLLGTIFGNNR